MSAKNRRQYVRRSMNHALKSATTKIENSLLSRGSHVQVNLKCDVLCDGMTINVTLPTLRQRKAEDDRKMQLLSIKRSKYSVSVSTCKGLLAEKGLRREMFAKGRRLNLRYFGINSLTRESDNTKGASVDIQRLINFLQHRNVQGNIIRLAIDSTPSRMYGRPATCAQICFMLEKQKVGHSTEWPIAIFLGKESFQNYKFFFGNTLHYLSQLNNIELWTVMDMESYSCIFPEFNFRSPNNPCFICCIDFRQCNDDYDFQKAWPKRQVTNEDVIQIPASRRLACMLHCGARVSEKLIDMFF